VAYSDVADLLTGDIPLPATIDPQKFVDDAADQIDSVIGFLYVTPIDTSDASPVVRPARLLLKRLNNFIASGRLILTTGIAGEETALHAYGKSLLDEANAILVMLGKNEIPIDGAVFVNPTDTTVNAKLMLVNMESASAVETFYEQVMPENPYWYPVRRYHPLWAPGN
jgi:hypothetical protein